MDEFMQTPQSSSRDLGPVLHYGGEVHRSWILGEF